MKKHSLEFGQRLRHWRLARGRTVCWLAERLHVMRWTLYRLENGIGGPTWDLAVELALALEISLDDFVDGPLPEIPLCLISETRYSEEKKPSTPKKEQNKEKPHEPGKRKAGLCRKHALEELQNCVDLLLATDRIDAQDVVES